MLVAAAQRMRDKIAAKPCADLAGTITKNRAKSAHLFNLN